MDPQHRYRGWVMLLMAFVAFAFMAALYASRPSEASAEPRAGSRKSAKASSPYTLFESGQVRPLAMSPDKRHLFAVNTPDNRLEIFRIREDGLIHTASIPVGLEPVAVAARTNHEVWVVNHLSDSVSVVELDEHGGDLTGEVERTLLVGDEPRDIVFAGPGRKRAFITTAHRGQNIPLDPQLATPLGSALGGTPLSIVTLFTDTPRALAVTPDGSRVYAAGFHTGNRTTAIAETSIPDGFGPDGVAGPAINAEGRPAPEVGEIVKWNGTHWVDSLGRSRDEFVRFSLPDKDVFVLDAMANPPRQLPGAGGFFQGVGTILYTMAVNPVNGKVYVANTEANNADRFEGPGTFASAREPHHRALTRGRHPQSRREAPQQAHRLQPLLRADPQRRERPVSRLSLGAGGDRQWRDPLRRGPGVRQGGGLLHGAAREKYVRAEHGESNPRERRRPHRPRPRRGSRAALRDDAFRQRDLDRRHEEADGSGARPDAQPGAAEHRDRPPVPL